MSYIQCLLRLGITFLGFGRSVCRVGLAVCALWGCTSEKVIVLRPHEVLLRPGDTLYDVAHRHGVLLRDLVRANNLKPPYTLKGLRKLSLPALTPSEDVEPENFAPSVTPLVAHTEDGPVSLRKEETESPSPSPVEEEAWTDVGDKDVVGPGEESNEPPPSAAFVAPKEEEATSTEPHSVTLGEENAAASAASQATLMLPAQGKLAKRFGDNDCMDVKIKMADGAKVYAPGEGTVMFVGELTPAVGRIVYIKHASGIESVTGPYNTICVKKGDTVDTQTTLGTFNGKFSGAGNDEHFLFFEVRQHGKPIDPMEVAKARTSQAGRSQTKASSGKKGKNGKTSGTTKKPPAKKKRPENT